MVSFPFSNQEVVLAIDNNDPKIVTRSKIYRRCRNTLSKSYEVLLRKQSNNKKRNIMSKKCITILSTRAQCSSETQIFI